MKMIQLIDIVSFSGNPWENIDDDSKVDLAISLGGAVPFGGLLIAFIIVLCRRKIEDFYLRWSLWVLFAAMGLRTVLSLILVVINWRDDSTNMLKNLKIEVVAFVLPYYFFLVVMVSLLFSAHTFYIKLRDFLYP